MLNNNLKINSSVLKFDVMAADVEIQALLVDLVQRRC